MLLSEGQMSDYKGAALMLDALPPAKALLGDRGYDAGWFRDALAERGIAACIPSKSNRKIPITHDRTLYRQRHKIENMFGKLKDWRRIHTRRACPRAGEAGPGGSLRPHLLLSHLHRGYRHLLDHQFLPRSSMRRVSGGCNFCLELRLCGAIRVTTASCRCLVRRHYPQFRLYDN